VSYYSIDFARVARDNITSSRFDKFNHVKDTPSCASFVSAQLRIGIIDAKFPQLNPQPARDSRSMRVRYHAAIDSIQTGQAEYFN